MTHNKWVKIPMMILFGALAIFVFGFVTMTLWNALIPELFHGPMLTYWQAMGLLLLSKILLGGGPRGRGGKGKHWRGKMGEKWERMTPEERVKFREQWGKKCGPWGFENEEKPSSGNNE